MHERGAVNRVQPDREPLMTELEIAATWNNAKAVRRAQRANDARALVCRRRRVDPTTCDRDYTADELEFMQAMQAYKQASGHLYPSWSEVLDVVMKLGYVHAPPRANTKRGGVPEPVRRHRDKSS